MRTGSRGLPAVVLACCLVVVGCSGSGHKESAPDDSGSVVSTGSGNDSTDSGAPSATPVDATFKVHGRSLYLQCDGTGDQTVILEAGLTGDHRTWDGIFPKLTSRARVCSYDRANIGASGPAPTPRTARDMVADLRGLLQAAHVVGPYVLVGFSFGGLITQLYARTHPDEVAGLVLVESNHPDEDKQFEAELTPRQIAADHADTAANPEGVDVFASFAQTRAAPALRQMPLVVVTAGIPEEWPPGWAPKVFNRLRAQQQADLAAMAQGGVQIIARKSSHDIPQQQPEVVVRAVEQILDTLS
jgi:pimeloyl-ACP methyl ester carboxylesterase